MSVILIFGGPLAGKTSLVKHLSSQIKEKLMVISQGSDISQELKKPADIYIVENGASASPKKILKLCKDLE